MAQNRLYLLGGAILAAIVAVVVVILVAGNGSGSPAPTTTTAASSGNEATSTFAGVPQHGDTLGRAAAPVTLTVYEDPQCPYCRQWNIDTLPTVVENYVRTGRLKIVYRGIPIISENSVLGLRAEYAAAEQNKLWQMVEELYLQQGEERSGWITLALVRDVARRLGLRPATIVTAMNSKSVTSAIRQSIDEAQALRVNGTPTFAIQKQLGALQELQVSGLEPADFTASLDQALQ